MSLLLLTYNFMHFLWIFCYSSKCFVNLFYSCIFMDVYIVFSLDSVSNKTTKKVFFFLYSFLFFASVLFLHVCLQPQARCAEET